MNRESLETWANAPDGPVALHLRQSLVPVGAGNGDARPIIFPPTYADIGYNIDVLADGTCVATIDSVGSQANRLEPLFKEGGPYSDLVPQVKIKIRDGVVVSLLDLAHRAADATVQSCAGLSGQVSEAFQALREGNATKLCAIAPTSLLFGVWDSRGGTGEKRPRLIRSTIRAWGVEVIHAAAQFNSVWKKLGDDQRSDLEGEAKKKKADLAEKGFKDAPATFRKTRSIPQYRDGSVNPEARVLGGVVVRERVEREVLINLVALRGVRGATDAESAQLRSYLLGMALLAATAETEAFLREGCLLHHSGDEDVWHAIPRRGEPAPVDLSNAQAVREFMQPALDYLKVRWPKTLEYEFSVAEAKKLLSKQDTDEQEA